MASPQLEDGYLKIANELWDALTRYRIPGEQRQCLDLIIRKTYGWDKKYDQISLSQFRQDTGISIRSCRRALEKLLNRKIIIINNKGVEKAHGRGDEKAHSQIISYGINKDFNQWIPWARRAMKKRIATKKRTVGVEKAHGRATKKRNTKDTLKDTNKDKEEYPVWLDLDLWKEFKKMRVKIKKPMTEKAEQERIKSLKVLMDQGYKQEDLVNQSIACCWQDFFPIKKVESQKESDNDHRMMCRSCKKKSNNIISGLCKKCREV